MRARFLIALLLACIVLPARASLFQDDGARQQINDLRTETNKRLDRLEASSQAMLDLANQIVQLKAQIATLRGQIEVLNHQLGLAQKRQQDFYIDLDSRLRKLEQAQQAATTAANPPPPVDTVAETRDYEAALNLFKSGKYKNALGAFQSFVKTYPKSPFGASANYWSGSAHFQLGEYKKAIEVFNSVATTWPDDPKAPDALLGVANAQQEMGNAKGARMTLEALVKKYPASAAAQVAKQRLSRKKK